MNTLPQKYQTMLDSIHDESVKNLYSKFSFMYYYYPIIQKNLENEYQLSFENILLSIVKNFKFMTFYIYSVKTKDGSVESEMNSNLVFCCEKLCLIIEEIDFSTITRIIKFLKENGYSAINTNENYDEDNKAIEEIQAEEEIQNFCFIFRKEINNNEFVRHTIAPIVGYLIRRFFYPTIYFQDPSFFDFKETNQTSERLLKSEFIDHLKSHKLDLEKLEDIKNKAKASNKIKEFQEESFVILRDLYWSGRSRFYLVIHIESLHIFAMKKHGCDITAREKEHEIYFCNNFSHRCLTHFYGFVKNEEEIVGFIYEFMSNDSLYSYVNSHPEKIDKMFSIMAINRIFQGIDYLHSHSLIHRDLKPPNILLDHDFLPYISDFETIRHPIQDDDEENESNNLTNDIGSMPYLSPEQYEGKNVSYPTDIYSFGLIIYFLCEKKDFSKSRILKNSPFHLQYIFEKCSNIDQNERLTAKSIKPILSENYFYLLNVYDILFNTTSQKICLLFESFMSLENLKKFCKIIADSTGSSYEFDSDQNEEHEEDLVCLGVYFEQGIGLKQDYDQARFEYDLLVDRINSSSNSLNHSGIESKDVQNENQIKISIEFYKKLAEQNDPLSSCLLGVFYENGKGVEKDYQKAKEYYEIGAKQEFPQSLFYLANLYIKGNGVKQDYDKAREYYEIAAKQNDPFAFNSLGDLYYLGNGVKQDYNKAKKYYELAAEQNNASAFINLGYLYHHGYGVKKDYIQAKKYYELAIEKDDKDAYKYLGELYLFGNGVKKSIEKAKKYYEISATCDYIPAFYQLGYICNEEHDYFRAMYYYEMAANNGISEAFLKIGDLYFEGKGVKKNYFKAMEYYEKSAIKNNSYALYKLGDIYYNGYGVKQDYDKAIKLYEESGGQGNSEALFKLGKIYSEGKGIEQNYIKAKKYFELAYYRGDINSLFYLGVFYSSDVFIEKNISKSIKYFKKSIEIHHYELYTYNNSDRFKYVDDVYNDYYYHSQNDLGLIYITIYEDIEKALEYIKVAAFAEYPFGQNNFGILNNFYLNKIGNAEYMYKRSSEHHFALAEYNLGHLKEIDNDIDESIKFYKKASDHENSPLIFQSRKHYDKRLEISKMFVICLTNLKITEYYFTKSKFEKSKKYFIRSFAKFNLSFDHIIDNLNPKNLFSYLKSFILNYPLFNLINQPNLSSEIKKIINSSKFNESNSKLKKSNDDSNKKMKCNMKYFQKKTLICSSEEEELNIKMKVDKSITGIDDFGKLFDFILSNEEFKIIFVKEIKSIIQLMSDIIYMPPYSILFGRIDIDKTQQNEKINPKKQNINNEFYEGFGIKF